MLKFGLLRKKKILKKVAIFFPNNFLKAKLSWREKAIFIFLTGLFIICFMLFFQPFGINNYYPSEKITPLFFFMVVVIGIWVMVLLSINEFLFRKLFPGKKSLLFMVFWGFWSLLWLSFGVFLFYNWIGGWHDWVFSSFLEFILNMGVLSLIPLIGLFLYLRIRDLRSDLERAYSYRYKSEAGEQMIRLMAENQKDQLAIPLKYIVFLESEDNYISIHHLKQDKLHKVLLRKSLKSVEEERHDPALLRCHRSFMINKMHLEQVFGNRNRLHIHLAQLEKNIPVGRQYIDEVFRLIENQSEPSH